MGNYNREQRRNERRRRLNLELSVLPIFTPFNDYDIYHINRETSLVLLKYLIDLARNATTRFTIDTERDNYTRRAALIQIEFIQQPKSIVLLFQTCHLPHTSSVSFCLIRSLFTVIFKSSNIIYSWGDAKRELIDFMRYELFSLHTLDQMNVINLQYSFKKWYNMTFLHDCGLKSFDDDVLCTCLHRPIKNRNDQWSLQKAIAYTFKEFLDKSRTKTHWSRCLLDITNMRSYAMIDEKQKKMIELLILYAVNDCLAVSKLLMVIESMWTKKQLEQYNENN